MDEDSDNKMNESNHHVEESDGESDYQYVYSDGGGSDDDIDNQEAEFGSMEFEGTSGNFDDSTSSNQVRYKNENGMTRQISVTTNIRMHYTAQIIPVMEQRIKSISELFAVPLSAAQPLLRRHNWASERLTESYYNDSDKEQKEAGVYHRCQNQTGANGNKKGDHYCAICFDDELKEEEMLLMPCGHEFCRDCWSCQIKTKLEDGPASILATCPMAKCNELVTEEEVAKVTPDLLPKFKDYQLRNFVEMNGNSRWCPGPGCDRIAAITAANGSLCDAVSIVAVCDKCSTCFCLKCGSEPHQPLLCAALDTWKEKCRNESETANWILANTKACPKCRTRIEKNQGCNHMTCQQCRYEFCWVCNADWKEHGSNTGGYYNCNKFEDKNDTEDQSDAAKAKRELDRYLHYYKRFHAHSEAQKFAMKQLKETGTRMMQLQECTGNTTWSDVEFLKTANEQLVECRRVLKFTYVFAYYMTAPVVTKTNATSSKNTQKGKGKASKKAEKVEEPKIISTEEEGKRKLQKDRFEYHQEMLERFTENLSEMAEKTLKDIDRTEVVNQTRVVKNFMQKILEYVANGMEDQTQ